MLKKCYRLKKNEDFKNIYNQGRSFATKSVVLFFKQTDDNDLKIGFSVSKKIGKAHTRNKIKRRMRSIIEHNMQNISSSKRIIFLARKPIVDFSYSNIQRDIIYLLKKSGVYNEEYTQDNTTKID